MNDGIDIGWLTDFLNRMERNTIKVGENAAKEAVATLLPEIATAFEESYKKCAAEWYGGYSPLYYARKDELTNAFVAGPINPEAGEFRWTFVQQPSAAFHTVFTLGYHGGAAHDGGYFWRAPYPYFTHWGREATQSVSILFLYSKVINDIEKEYTEKLSNLAQQIFNKNAGSIVSM